LGQPPSDSDLDPTLPVWEEEVTDSSPTIASPHERLPAPPDLGDKFEVLDFVGRGGMGAVYRVRHKQLDHVRAVKVLSSAADPLLVQRLRREASIATGLTHPNIVTVYDLETLDDGSLAIVMELLEGQDLSVQVARGGRMDTDEVRRRFRPVADALDRMHAAGVIHRDIKPANLFVCDDGTIKILDFGISRLAESDSGLTQTGGIIGTPAYMAPEQIEGDPISAATDIYSLGVAMFFCLTGHKPYQGRTQIETISKVLAGEPPRADELCEHVPTHVAHALDRALAREPADRWATAGELLAAMESEETRAFRVSLSSRRRRVVVRNAAVAGVGLVTAAVLGAVAVWTAPWETDPVTEEPTGPAEADPAFVPPTGGTIRAGLTANFPSLDPTVAKTDNFTYVQHLLYDPLVDVDWRGELMPGLAERWEAHDGDRRFVFHLRGDAILHDDPCLPDGRGHPVDAVDVQRSLERVFRSIVTDDDTTWAFLPPIVGFDAYLAGGVEHPEGLAVVDERTVEVRFTRPAPVFLYCLQRPLWSIVAAEAIDTYPEFTALARGMQRRPSIPSRIAV